MSAHGDTSLAAAPMASAPAPATTPPIRRAPAATLPQRSMSRSPSHQCMRPTRCSTRAPSMPSPTRCAPAKEHLCRAGQEEQGRFPSHPVESALGTPGCATPTALLARPPAESCTSIACCFETPESSFPLQFASCGCAWQPERSPAQHHMNWTAASDGRAGASQPFTVARRQSSARAGTRACPARTAQMWLPPPAAGSRTPAAPTSSATFVSTTLVSLGTNTMNRLRGVWFWTSLENIGHQMLQMAASHAAPLRKTHFQQRLVCRPDDARSLLSE